MKGAVIMDIRRILSAVDHTLLSPVATQAEVYALCDEAIAYRTASVCIPPAFVASVRDYVTDKMRVCTVVGFPNGYNTTASKVYEARNAIENGADEIDMVINIGWLRDKKYAELLSEIKAVRAARRGGKNQGLRACRRFRRGLYQNEHRLFVRRRDKRGYPAFRHTSRADAENQGSRRDFLACGRGGDAVARRGQAWNEPDRKAREGA